MTWLRNPSRTEPFEVRPSNGYQLEVGTNLPCKHQEIYWSKVQRTSVKESFRLVGRARAMVNVTLGTKYQDTGSHQAETMTAECFARCTQD
jgi:hypothetical protein